MTTTTVNTAATAISAETVTLGSVWRLGLATVGRVLHATYQVSAVVDETASAVRELSASVHQQTTAYREQQALEIDAENQEKLASIKARIAAAKAAKAKPAAPVADSAVPQL